jgi:hypothetical protein
MLNNSKMGIREQIFEFGNHCNDQTNHVSGKGSSAKMQPRCRAYPDAIFKITG